jgi:hypothetical protein
MANVIPGVSVHATRNHVLRLHRIEAVGSSFETGVSCLHPLRYLNLPLEDFTSPLQFKIGMEKEMSTGCESIFYSPIHRTFYLSSILNAQATAPQTPHINKERKVNARRVIPPRTPNPCPSQSINLFKALNSMLSIQESGRAGERKERNERNKKKSEDHTSAW